MTPRTLLFQAIIALFALSVAAMPSTSADDAAAPDDARLLDNLGGWAAPVFRVNEFFDTTLPGTLDPFDLALDIRPRLGDFVGRHFIRFPMELRYGWTDDFEIISGWTPVTPNPFRSGDGRKWSPGEAGLGFRYNLDARVEQVPIATFSLYGRTPLGRPPTDLIDGYAHVEPRLALMRPFLEERIFLVLNLVYDRSFNPPGHSRPDPGEVTRQHIAEVIPGVIYMPGELGYVLQYTFRHIDEPMEDRLAHAYRAGIIWEVPRERSAQWNIPGTWQIEASYELTDEEERSLDHAILLRARVRLELRRHSPSQPEE